MLHKCIKVCGIYKSSPFLSYLTLDGHLNKFLSVILQGTLGCYIESVKSIHQILEIMNFFASIKIYQIL